MILTTCRNCEESKDGEEKKRRREKQEDDAGLDADAALLHGEGDDGITVRARTFNTILS